jgi:hypothetical protein
VRFEIEEMGIKPKKVVLNEVAVPTIYSTTVAQSHGNL